ncbi:hypothetical protein [Massilia sp. NR 4-1]|uniref:hypothetical protein n=1 Tax=Massilia sp. NR 4-1 TaxID=1678028 RepID=UPI00067CDD36|nr:hypothetical protein [Massilia sp. NR 4-1]AKU23503.1 hypothetical protein ACZ75_20625 [Massilia sp. NR 4-1]
MKMIPVTYINRNTSALTVCFNKANKPLLTLLYAKLVIIEIGGWVEMSMDDLIERAGKKIKDPKNVKVLEQDIRRNSGFQYDTNFRPLLIKVVGLVRVEQLEAKLDMVKHTKMKAALDMLKAARNSVAHTYVKNPSGGAVIAAPSVSITYFKDICDGLMNIESEMKKLKII